MNLYERSFGLLNFVLTILLSCASGQAAELPGIDDLFSGGKISAQTVEQLRSRSFERIGGKYFLTPLLRVTSARLVKKSTDFHSQKDFAFQLLSQLVQSPEALRKFTKQIERSEDLKAQLINGTWFPDWSKDELARLAMAIQQEDRTLSNQVSLLEGRDTLITFAKLAAIFEANGIKISDFSNTDDFKRQLTTAFRHFWMSSEIEFHVYVTYEQFNLPSIRFSRSDLATDLDFVMKEVETVLKNSGATDDLQLSSFLKRDQNFPQLNLELKNGTPEQQAAASIRLQAENEYLQLVYQDVIRKLSSELYQNPRYLSHLLDDIRPILGKYGFFPSSKTWSPETAADQIFGLLTKLYAANLRAPEPDSGFSLALTKYLAVPAVVAQEISVSTLDISNVSVLSDIDMKLPPWSAYGVVKRLTNLEGTFDITLRLSTAGKRTLDSLVDRAISFPLPLNYLVSASLPVGSENLQTSWTTEIVPRDQRRPLAVCVRLRERSLMAVCPSDDLTY